MKAAIIIGHSSTSQGAVNKSSGVTEFLYNNKIAQMIREYALFDVELVYRTGTYSQLPAKVNKTNADIAISLHCNAYNKQASGTCTLSSGSEKSLKLAKIIHADMLDLFMLKDRGVQIRKRSKRGGLILHETNMPCVLLEPFFIDNNNDYAIGIENSRAYAITIIEAINKYQKL